jgi:hypothetical protein
LPIEQQTKCVHEGHAQQAIAQVPQIACPDTFGPTAIGQLPKDGIDAIAHPTQHGTPTVGWLVLGTAVGCQLDDTHASQRFFELGQPIVAITQQQPAGSGCQLPGHIAFKQVGWRQAHLGDHAWPTQPHMQAKAIEGLPTGMIFAIAGRVVKAPTAGGTRKLADRDGHAVHNGHGWVIEQEAIGLPVRFIQDRPTCQINCGSAAEIGSKKLLWAHMRGWVESD